MTVTGTGAVTPVGPDAPSTTAALQAGRSGVVALTEDWAAGLPVRIAALVPAGFERALETRLLRRTDRVAQLALVAGREAWAQAALGAVDPDRAAVVVGTAIGGLRTTIEQQGVLDGSGPRRILPHTVTMIMANSAAAWLSMDLGARAGARTVVSACASGSEAIAVGRELILSGAADVVLAGGAEACVTALGLSSFAQTRALSIRDQDPALASRPFDIGRDGFVLGEGAAFVVLESEEHARARGALALGHVAGAALTSDAFDIVAADPDHQARTMSLALASAGLAPQDVGVVHAHATSTPLGDLNESRAILQALGAHVAVTSTKSMSGHLLGASGALGVLAALDTLARGSVPATTNVDTVDPQVEVDVVTGTARPTTATAALVNAFGFGGHNASVVVTAA